MIFSEIFIVLFCTENLFLKYFVKLHENWKYVRTFFVLRIVQIVDKKTGKVTGMKIAKEFSAVL